MGFKKRSRCFAGACKTDTTEKTGMGPRKKDTNGGINIRQKLLPPAKPLPIHQVRGESLSKRQKIDDRQKFDLRV